MKLGVKIALGALGLVILAIASIPLFVNANTFRPAIEKQLTTTLGRSVKLGNLKLSVFTRSLIAEEISVADDPGFSTAPFLTARDLRIGIHVRPLVFSHQVKLRSFEIESPQIALIRAANGTWNFSSIGHLAAANSPANSSAEAPVAGISKSSTQGLADLSVGLIAIAQGRVTVARLPAHGDPSVYDHVNIAVHDFSFASQFPFELSSDLPAGGIVTAFGNAGPISRNDATTSPFDMQIVVKHLDPVGAGFLNPDAGVTLLADLDVNGSSDGQTLTTKGAVHVQKLKLRKGGAAAPETVDLTYSGTRHLKENTGEIQDASITVGSASIHIGGTYQPVAPGAEDLLLKLKIAGHNLPIDDLQTLMTATGIRLPNGSKLSGGTLTMNLAVFGQTKSLAITGPIAVDNAQLVGFDIGSKIHGIAALSGVKTGDTTKIEKLRATVHVTNAGVLIDEIDAMIAEMGELTGSGTVSADNQLDFNLIVKVTSAKGIGEVGAGLLTKLNGSSGSSGKISGVPMHVTGTPDEPNITADVGGIFHKKAKSIASFFGQKK